MTRLHDLVRFESARGMQWPRWVERIVSLGIVTVDAKVARRQRIVNVASYAGALNGLSRILLSFSYTIDNAIVVQAASAFFAVTALLIPALHRFGENVAGMALVVWFLTSLAVGVSLFGLQSQIQVYFALGGLILLLFGVENWRLFLCWLALLCAEMMIVILYAPEHGIALPPGTEDTVRKLALQSMFNAIAINAALIFYALLVLQRTESDLERQRARAEALVNVVLPESIARRLRSGKETTIADRIDGVTLLFADLADFTPVAHQEPPEKVVAYLNEFVQTLDIVCESFGVEKIKTIGDAYMVVGGLHGDSRAGAIAVARLALEMLKVQERRPPLAGRKLRLRIGIHHGTAIAGVIGDTRISYDLWGDAVNLASRMESHGVPGRIQVSDEYRSVLPDSFEFEERGTTDIKGIGVTRTWFLLREKD